jgi:hypothetical protein
MRGEQDLQRRDQFADVQHDHHYECSLGAIDSNFRSARSRASHLFQFAQPGCQSAEFNRKSVIETKVRAQNI